MPVQINQVDAEVQVEGGTPPAQPQPTTPANGPEQWAEQQRRARQLEARTASFDFDD
jgi:hypothetical protein